MSFWEQGIVHFVTVAVATVLIGLVLLLVLRLPRRGCPKCGAKETFAITGIKPGSNRAVERRFNSMSLVFMIWGIFFGVVVAGLGVFKDDWLQTIAGVACVIGVFWFVVSRPVIRCNVCAWQENIDTG
jgi:hypothetical protein